MPPLTVLTRRIFRPDRYYTLNRKPLYIQRIQLGSGLTSHDSHIVAAMSDGTLDRYLLPKRLHYLGFAAVDTLRNLTVCMSK